MKRLITAELVASERAAGRTQLVAPRGETIVTPEAWSKAAQLGVEIVQGDEASTAGPPDPDARCARVVDRSGVIVVRGQSVKLDRFPGAGADRNVRLLDVVTGKDRSPMTAGFMSWNRTDAFPWTLDYDEVDLVVEGTLHITVDGRTLEGHAGDVFYIPKGTSLVFGTPTSTRVLYVTYPANWSKPG